MSADGPKDDFANNVHGWRGIANTLPQLANARSGPADRPSSKRKITPEVANKGLSRATLLQRLRKPANFDPQGAVSDTDLLAEYCEALVAAVPDPAKKSA